MLDLRQYLIGVKHKQYLVIVIASLAVAVLYIPNIKNNFVEWDLQSYRYILESRDYLKTSVDLFLDFKGKIVPGYYAPISSISLMADKLPARSDEPVPSLTLLINLLFHIFNGCLVFLLLKKINAPPETAVIACIIFLIHPLQVSSIMWFAQRKGVMAAAFYLIAYINFIEFVRTRRPGNYIFSLAAFIAAVLSKPTVVVFPAALLLTRLLRIGEDVSAAPGNRSSGMVALIRSAGLIEITPFMMVAAGFALITIQTEGATLGEGSFDYPLLERPFMMAAAIWFYVEKIIFPVGISPLYGTWHPDPSSPIWWIPLMLLLVSIISAVYFRKNLGMNVFWALGNFLIPLIPVCGLFKFGYLRLSPVADHFLYLSMVGAAHVMAIIMTAVWKRLTPARYVLAGCALLYASFFAIQTWKQTSIWENSVKLWSHNLEHNPDDWTAHNFLGHALLNSSRPLESIDHFQRVISLKEQYLADHGALKKNVADRVERGPAEREKTKTAYIASGMHVAHHNLGNAFLMAGIPSRAAEQFKIAHKLAPGYAKSGLNLGVAYLALGDTGAAIEALKAVLKLEPNSKDAHYNLGIAYEMSGDKLSAQRHFQLSQLPQKAVPEK